MSKGRLRAGAYTGAHCAPLLLIILLLTACAPLLENDYISITPLTESTPEPVHDTVDGLKASTYNELKNAVLWLVRNGDTEGNVRLRNYNGNVTSDVERVCRDVWLNEPVGNYALEYITPTETTRLISEYDISFSLTYRHTYEQIQAVENINGEYAFEERFRKTITDFETELIFETSLFYNEEQFDFEQIKNRIYYGHPESAQGMPELEKKFYPESGLHRIVELKLRYPDDTAQLKEQAGQCRPVAASIVDALSSKLTTPEKALALYKELGKICTFDHGLYAAMADGQKVYPTTYDAFFNERVLPESYALAYKLLCDLAGIPCHVVTGQRGADEHVWNLIQLEGNWYHVDLSADDMGDVLTFKHFLVTDSVMLTDYRWKGTYPSAESGELTYESIAGEEE